MSPSDRILVIAAAIALFICIGVVVFLFARILAEIDSLKD